MQHFSGRSFREERSHGTISLLLYELSALFQHMAVHLFASAYVTEAKRGKAGEELPGKSPVVFVNVP